MGASEDLESIRQYIRSICVHNQTHWESSWKSILKNNETARRGLVHPDVFIRTLKENNVIFPRKIVHALVEQFQAPNGGVQAAKFLKWIELSRPSDHVDPELVFARLPQPYRRIVKILDKDILDASWELIKQQSTRFKAEAAAALAATARSSGADIDSLTDFDDYEGAKKRCCKNFDRKDLGNNRNVVRAAQHDTLPVLVVALEAEAPEKHQHATAVLQMFSTLTHEQVAEYTFPIEESAEPSSSDPAADAYKRYHVAGLTTIRIRSITQDGGNVTLAFGVHVTEFSTIPATEDQPESSSSVMSVHVFEVADVDIFALSTPGGAAAANTSKISFRLAATGRFEHVEWLEMSPGGQHVALSPVSGNLAVFKISSKVSTEEPPLKSSSEDSLVVDFNTAAPLMKKELQFRSSSVCRVHFVVKPTLKRLRSSSRFQPPEAYALIVCYGINVSKYILSSSADRDAVPVASWDHLAAITSSAMDATTQFLAVGLADGAVAVWDSFEDDHYAYLSPSMASASETSSFRANGSDGLRIDAVVMYRNEFIVTLSSSKQQVRFFDIRKPAAPQLYRVVIAPAPPTAFQQSEGVNLESLVETVNVLDVPIAVVGYSNGMHVLYDMRTAIAIGSIRSRSQPNRDVQTAVLASQHGIAVAQSSQLDFYDWCQLLLAAYPSFEHVLKERDLAKDPITAKRLFLSSYAGLRIAALAPQVGAAESIDKLLCRTAKLSLASLPSLMASSTATLLNQRQVSNSKVGLTASDSSISSHYRGSLINLEEVPQLPPLPEVLLQPSTLSVRERFEDYCRELEASVTKEKEARMHRRRRELLKALTTGAW